MIKTLEPLKQGQRDKNLDILRGFAMAGVLFVFCAGDINISKDYVNSPLDEAIKWFKWVMIEGRMYGMLLMVFGIGFSVQLQKANQRGESLVPVFSRRLIGLLLIGFIHAIFLSTRDILMFYAVAGFALLPARRFSPRKLLIFIVIAFITWMTLPEILKAVGIKFVRIDSWVSPNDYPAYLAYNWDFFKSYHQIYTIYFDMLLFFLVGFYVGKTRLLTRIETERKLRRQSLLVSFIVSAALASFLYGWFYVGGSEIIFEKITSSWLKILFRYAAGLLWQTHVLSFVTLYATILISLNALKYGQKLLQLLAAFGQMAMSNYLIQSILIVPYALWFDKFDHMPPFNGTVLFLTVLGFQLIFSSWWLKHFRFGPFEWLLRSFTYWQWQPIKVKRVNEVLSNDLAASVVTVE
jgi:uncharacterized protein